MYNTTGLQCVHVFLLTAVYIQCRTSCSMHMLLYNMRILFNMNEQMHAPHERFGILDLRLILRPFSYIFAVFRRCTVARLYGTPFVSKLIPRRLIYFSSNST